MSLTPDIQQGNLARIPWVRAFLLTALAAATMLAGLPARADLPAPKPPLPTQSNPPQLAQPVDCAIGETCYIQNYFDADPGPAARDFRCNPHSYDGHKGTDFAVATLADMARGVTVMAAAPGRVRGTRDGMQDGAFLAKPDSVKDIECGNGLVIDHGQGWVTQYCHLRKGSLLVKPGQQVETGTPLGLVGQSGLAEFPHLHFSVRYLQKPVDPFNPDGLDACALPPPRTLWQDHPPTYTPGGVLLAGFAPRMPALEIIQSGGGTHATLPADSAQLLLWGYLFGARAGDEVRIEISGSNSLNYSRKHIVPRNMAILSRGAAWRRAGAAWPAGTYTGRVTLLRGGQSHSQKITTVEIAP